jgi:hypothetical protein
MRGAAVMIIYLARSIVGIALVLSACWKLRHQVAFRESLRRFGGSRLRRHDRPVARILPVAEIATGAGLLIDDPIGRASACVAFIMILAFSLLMIRADDLSSGCGCWPTPAGGHADSRPLLIRNGFLLAFSVVGAIPAGSITPLILAFYLASGSVFALTIMEIPHLALVAFPSREVERSR